MKYNIEVFSQANDSAFFINPYGTAVLNPYPYFFRDRLSKSLLFKGQGQSIPNI